MALMLLLTACRQSTETIDPKTWQEAYTQILQEHDDAVGNIFFLADADGDGIPELYRLRNFRGNEVCVSDFARGIREVSVPFCVSEMYYNKIGGTLGIYHRDGGPAGDIGPITSEYSQVGRYYYEQEGYFPEGI